MAVVFWGFRCVVSLLFGSWVAWVCFMSRGCFVAGFCGLGSVGFLFASCVTTGCGLLRLSLVIWEFAGSGGCST
ncbi:hypothetical protein, partial [Acinetobacter baumannii]